MPKSRNQKLKILYLKKILQEKTDSEHTLTLQTIIKELEDYGVTAERKSLYDDFDALRLFGVDVESKKGADSGYYIANRTFELPELKLLVDAVQSSKFITRRKSTELIKKIESLASRYEAVQLQRQVYVANRIKTMNETIYYSVDRIHEAITGGRKISFLYYEWNVHKEKVLRHGGERYRVSPWALTWDDENYYLIAYDSNAEMIKHYRVDKMQSISIVDEVREGGERFENFDMALYSKKTFGMYGGDDAVVTLRCAERMAGVIIDRFGDIPFIKMKDGFFEISVKVSVSPLFLSWVMNFGTDMKIIAPSDVAERLKETARAVIEQYENI